MSWPLQFIPEQLRDHIRESVKKRRKELGITQGELAAKTGFTVRTISRIETGAAMPSAELLDQLGIDYKIAGIEQKPERTVEVRRDNSRTTSYYQIVEMLHYIDAEELAEIAALVAKIQQKK